VLLAVEHHLLTDYSQVDVLVAWYKSVNFGANTDLGFRVEVFARSHHVEPAVLLAVEHDLLPDYSQVDILVGTWYKSGANTDVGFRVQDLARSRTGRSSCSRGRPNRGDLCSMSGQLLLCTEKGFQGGLVFKARRLLYHSSLGRE